MNPGAVIIDVPERRTPCLRWRDWMLTMLLWGLWIFICRDVLLFLGWVIGIYGGILQIDAMLELRNVADPLKVYCRTIATIAVMVVAWALCSRDVPDARRRWPRTPEVRDLELAEFFNIEPRDVTRCTAARRIVMHHHEDGLLAAIEADLVRPEERLSAGDCGDPPLESRTDSESGAPMHRLGRGPIALTPDTGSPRRHAARVKGFVGVMILPRRWLRLKSSHSPHALRRNDSLSIGGYIG